MTETFFMKEVEKYQYFPMPKWLFKEPYKNLSNDAKVMYTLLFNLLNRSLENDWYDANGKVYMQYRNDKLSEELGCSENTVIKFKKELRDAGLLHEERQGLTKPNRLYLKGPKVGSEPQHLRCRTAKFTEQEPQDLRTIKTNIIKTNINNNNMSSKDDMAIIEEVVAYLNKVTNSKFNPKTKTTQRLIRARLRDGYKPEHFKRVIDNMYGEWHHKPNLVRYLRPTTLFSESHFDDYLNNKTLWKKNFEDVPDERLGF